MNACAAWLNWTHALHSLVHQKYENLHSPKKKEKANHFQVYLVFDAGGSSRQVL